MTAWCGSFLASRKAGTPSLSWGLLHAQLGIGLVSSGTAALNEVMERDTDGRMPSNGGASAASGTHETAACHPDRERAYFGWISLSGPGREPARWPAHLAHRRRLSRRLHASEAGFLVVHVLWGHAGRLGLGCRPRSTGMGDSGPFRDSLPVAVSPLLLDCLALSGRLCAGRSAHAPVVNSDGRSTALRIEIYSVALIPVSMLPSFTGIAGHTYMAGAAVLGLGLLYFGIRLAQLRMPRPPRPPGSGRVSYCKRRLCICPYSWG